MRRSIHKPALRIQGLSVSYGKTNILADASFELDAGEAVALWGENGAGKTTLLRTVLGLLRHEGTVEVMGVDIRNGGRDTRARIGYVPQEIRLEDGTVQEVVQTYAALRGARGREAALLVERLGLREHERKQTSALSGGLRQRLALALALLNDPPLLLLDEPTANLDAAARADYLVHLQMLRKEGKAILFTSHRMDEIGALASRVVVLQNARHVVVEARRFLSEAEVARA